MSLIDLLIGDVKENAAREYLEGNYDPTDGNRKRSFGDVIGETLFGRKEATDKAVQDLYTKNLDDTYGVDIDKIKRTLRNDNVDFGNLNINQNTNATKLKQTIAQLNDQVANRKSLIEAANLKGFGELAAALPTNQITGMIKAEKRTEAEEAQQTKLDQQIELFKLQSGAENKLQADRLASAERMAIRKDLSADKLRAQTARLSILQAENQRASNKDKFTLGQMQTALEGRRLDMQQEEQNKKSMNQMIATLVGGLKGLNNSTQSFMPPRSYYTL
tara:strand:- start:1808 stop:2632 length:825 start_codon:yes stop_codon:yes gene_type:complete